MTWWGRRKGDLPVLPDAKTPASAITSGISPQLSNVIEFPQKSEIPPENRLAVHQLIDKILDGMSADEYLMIEICGSDEPLNSA